MLGFVHANCAPPSTGQYASRHRVQWAELGGQKKAQLLGDCLLEGREYQLASTVAEQAKVDERRR